MQCRHGSGFGFHGVSPPWPYTGRGRGALPRCSYPGLWRASSFPVSGPYGPTLTREEELGFLKEQAGVMKSQFEDIESRIKELEKND